MSVVPTPFPQPHLMLGFLLNRLASEFRTRTDAALKPFGISPRALGLLLTVAQKETLSQVEIARRLGFDRTTMSQLVEDLRQADWIGRETQKSDRRSHVLSLTSAGARRLTEASAAAKAVEKDLMRMFSSDDAEDFKQRLALMLASLEGGDGFM